MIHGLLLLAWGLLFADAPLLLAPPQPMLRAPEAPGYVLHRTKDGGYTYEEGGWSVAIAPDGSVRFTDHNIRIQSLKLGPINLGGPPSGRPTLQSWLRDMARKGPPPDPWAETRAQWRPIPVFRSSTPRSSNALPTLRPLQWARRSLNGAATVQPCVKFRP